MIKAAVAYKITNSTSRQFVLPLKSVERLCSTDFFNTITNEHHCRLIRLTSILDEYKAQIDEISG